MTRLDMRRIDHKGIYGVLKKENSILLVRKSRGPYKGLFDFPGGRKEEGESDEEALVRELKEETGIVPIRWMFLDTFVYECSYIHEGEKIEFHHRGNVFFIEQYDDQSSDLNIIYEDVHGCSWCSLESIEECSPPVKLMREKLKRFLG